MAKKKPAATKAAKSKKPASKAGNKSGKLSAKPVPKGKANFALTPKSRAAKSGAAKSAAPAAKSGAKAGKSAGTPAAKSAAPAASPVALKRVAVDNKSKTNVTDFFSPLDDRLILEEVKTELRTAGGLFIPDTAAPPDGPARAKVLAAGRGTYSKKGKLQPLDVKVGDTVLFQAFMGDPLKIGDRTVTVVRESQILGIVND